MNLLVLPHMLSACLILGVGLTVLCKGQSARVNQLFAWMCALLAVWLTCFSIGQHTATVEAFLFWERLGHAGIAFAPVTYVHFMIIFLGYMNARWRIAIQCLYLYAVIMTCLVVGTPWYFPSTVHYYAWGRYPQSSALLSLNAAYTICCLLSGWMALRRAYQDARRSGDTLRYRQLKPLRWPLSIIVFAALDFVPKYGIGLYPIGFVFVSIFSVGIAYCVLRYQLFDITVVIRKSVIYSTLVALITAMYLAFVVIIEQLLQDIIGYDTRAPSVLAAFIIAFSFNPLRHWIQSFVDRYFFRGTQAAISEENDRLRHELQHTEKMKAVSLFASGMAHEIKNPLTSLKTFVEHLPSKGNDAAFREKFARIVGNEVKNIESIVHRLLDFARPSKLEIQPIRLSSVLDDTLGFLQADMVKKHLKLTKSYTDNDTVRADPAQLKQVFLNLFLNAIDATPSGGTISTAITPNGRYVHVTITDTGHGMTPDDLKRAGEPFFTTKATGTGLGLAVVKGIVEGHGGRIDLDSEMDRGTSVKIALPMDTTC